MKPKDLIGIPWRVAFALQEAGWWRIVDRTPEPVNRLLDLLAQLPENLEASSRETNHYELVSPHDGESYWWLDVGEMLHHAYTQNPHTYGQTLDRLQLLLDLAVAAKAAEPYLRQLASALT